MDFVAHSGSLELATQLVDDRLRTRGVEAIQQGDDPVTAELLAALISAQLFPNRSPAFLSTSPAAPVAF